ncbi:hypothetical protein D3C80_1860860 [compost metagenome]
MEGTLLHRRHGILDVAVAGHHDQLERRVAGAELLDQLMAAHPGQGIVREDHVGAESLQLLQRVFRRMAGDHLEVLALEVGLDVLRQQFVVFNQQDAVFHTPHPRQS